MKNKSVYSNSVNYNATAIIAAFLFFLPFMCNCQEQILPNQIHIEGRSNPNISQRKIDYSILAQDTSRIVSYHFSKSKMYQDRANSTAVGGIIIGLTTFGLSKSIESKRKDGTFFPDYGNILTQYAVIAIGGLVSGSFLIIAINSSLSSKKHKQKAFEHYYLNQEFSNNLSKSNNGNCYLGLSSTGLTLSYSF